MSAIHPAMLAEEALLADCETRRGRRSGPGGQHRNKVETAIVLIHRPSGVQAEATERRSQADNLRAAVFRLRVKLAIELRRPLDTNAFTPSSTWQARVKGRRIAVNPEHADFPALLAEALDVVASAEYDVAAAAECLGISTTQLVRLLAKQPAALAKVNAHRAAHDLRPLR